MFARPPLNKVEAAIAARNRLVTQLEALATRWRSLGFRRSRVTKRAH